MTSRSSSYYEVLDVPVDADAASIRKAYLKKSLKYHPDKNPDSSEEAKAKFIQIGQAYEVLSDPTTRRIYDQEIRRGGRRASYNGFGNTSGYGNGGASPSDQAYDKYRDAFDTAAASMSESDLATIARLAGVVGAVLSSRMLGGADDGTRRKSASGKRSVLVSAGSAMGGLAASASVRALHRDSLKRLSHKEECRKAVERGEPMPPPPKTSSMGTVFKKALESVANDMESKKKDKKDNKTNDGFHQSAPNNDQSSSSSSETYGGGYRDYGNSSETNSGGYCDERRSTNKYLNKFGKKLWKAAVKEGVKAAQRSSSRVH